jgi:hypothetical protein
MIRPDASQASTISLLAAAQCRYSASCPPGTKWTPIVFLPLLTGGSGLVASRNAITGKAPGNMAIPGSRPRRPGMTRPSLLRTLGGYRIDGLLLVW